MPATFVDKFREIGRRIGPNRGGVALMLVGAASLFAGIAQTTSATPPGAPCPKDTVLFAKFNWDGKTYVFEKGSGGARGVLLTDGTDTGAGWSSGTAISAIVVKGGPGSVTTTLIPPQVAGTFTNAGLPPVGSGNTPAISNVQFCVGSAATTTVPDKTTTTEAVTTTTAPVTTTTAPVTTTVPDKTTTTEAVTTTTASATTTTAPVTTTTGAVTTTTAPVTTTTGAVTTTTAPVTTTTGAVTTTTGAVTTTTAPVTTTTRATTTTGASSTTGVSTTTIAPTTTVAVGGKVVTSTSVSEDDEQLDSLAYTGAPSLLLVLFGITLFLAGGAIVAIARLREPEQS